MLATEPGHRASRFAYRVLIRASVPALAIAILASAVSAGAADDAPPLRLCADPTNLPFSSDDPARPGIYLEIGKALGAALGRPVAYDWYKSYFGKRTVRVTLLGKQCDAMIGLPLTEDFMGPAVIFSKPLLSETYALVSAKGAPIGGINDLKGKRVAVQFLSTPQNMLAMRDDIDKVTVLSPDAGMKALDDGVADVAFVWGAVAGWLNKSQYGERFQVQPVEGPGLSWQTAIGFAKGSKELRDQVDAALPGLQSAINEAVAKYGIPSAAPVKFGAINAIATRQAAEAESPLPVVRAQASGTAPVTPAVATAAAPAGGDGSVSEGKEIFNGNCAHCHGPDAVQAERKIDLRLLKKRYGDEMRDKFWTTVHDGRPSKGMPAWKDVYTEDQFKSIYAYLLTVQAPAN